MAMLQLLSGILGMYLQIIHRVPALVLRSFEQRHADTVSEPSLLTAPSSNTQGCSENSSLTPILQIPSLANFGPHCLGVVGHIPVWISLLAFVLHYALVWFDPWRPIWLRNITAEKGEARFQSHDQEEAGAIHDESFEDTPLLPRRGAVSVSPKKIWTRWTLCLLVLNLTGALISIFGAAMAHQNPTEIQLHLIPLIPNVRCNTSMAGIGHFWTPY